jgi:glycosyltransferase involved in cell wall biosynthesis
MAIHRKIKKILAVGADSSTGMSGQTFMFDYSIDLLRKIQNVKVDIVYLPNPQKRKVWQRIYYHLVFFKEIIAGINKNDVIFFQTTQSFLGFFRDLPLLLFTTKKKKIVQILGGYYGYLIESQPSYIKNMLIKGLSKADLLLIETEATKDTFRFAQKVFEKLEILPNGVIINEKKNLLRTPTPDNLKILFLSSMIKEKGYDDVLAAAEILRNNHNINVDLTFVGPFLFGGEAEFKNSIKDKAYVSYFKSIIGHQKTQLYLSHHFFILPSYYINEGQPLALLEAMGHGCVCIATDYRGIASTIENGLTGIFVKPQDPVDIARKITSVMKDDIYDKIRQNAIVMISQKHTNACFEKSFEQKINRII